MKASKFNLKKLKGMIENNNTEDFEVERGYLKWKDETREEVIFVKRKKGKLKIVKKK